MYKTIMVPVDLEDAGRLDKALATASDLARHYDATVCYVGVAAATPGRIARTPDEFARKLDAFGRGEAERRGHRATSKALTSHDPAADLDDRLLDAVQQTGADLVVVQSHIPGGDGHRLAVAWRLARQPRRGIGLRGALSRGAGAGHEGGVKGERA